MNILLGYKGCVLLEREYEYVVACGYDKATGTWEHGKYFSHWNHNNLEKTQMLSKAVEYLRAKVDEEYISRSRLEELVEDSLHALIEDDRETALEYFDKELELTEYERKYFGIDTKSEEE